MVNVHKLKKIKTILIVISADVCVIVVSILIGHNDQHSPLQYLRVKHQQLKTDEFLHSSINHNNHFQTTYLDMI